MNIKTKNIKELEKLGLHYGKIELGEVVVREDLTADQHEQLKIVLLKSGLELMDDKKAILIDKVESTGGIKVSSEIGIQMPSFAGAGIKAMLAQLPDEEIDALLSKSELKKYTPNSIIDKSVYKKEVIEVRTHGVAYDREEYFVEVREARKE